MNALEELLFSQIEKAPNGDWLWVGTTRGDARGYVSMSAYRLMYLLYKGAVAEGMHLDHLCGNPQCVNPDHLEVTTPRANILRSNGRGAINARVTHCPRGHAYDEANTYIDKRGRRYCKACTKATSREWMTAKRRRDGMPERAPKGIKTHCIHGHEYTPENTYLSPAGDKICRACKKTRGRDWMRAKRAQLIT